MADLHLLRRWTVFNLVGAMGVAVQLAALAGLVRWFGVNYLLATAIAVEAALLHNFAWHQCWTWRDRPARSVRGAVGRLARFLVLNGTVSLVGNLALMGWLSGVVGLDPIIANVISIVACSAVNFAAGTTLVFRPTQAVIAVLVLGWASPAAAGPGSDALTGPGSEAVKGWTAYEASVDGRYASGTDSGAPFFVQDERGRTHGWRAAALRGDVAVISLDAPKVAGATIHHWAGAVFVPGMTVDQVLATLQEQAGSEEQFYEDVVTSRLLSRAGSRVTVFMKLRRKTVLTVAYNTEHAVEYRRIGARRGSSRSVATRIAELDDAGTPAEREKPEGSDHGFLWRLNAYWRYEETPGGVLIECESVSLSRAVPALARPIVSPVLSRVARESLVRTLRAMRAALSSRAR